VVRCVGGEGGVGEVKQLGLQNRKLEERKHVTLSQVIVLSRCFNFKVLDTLLCLQRAQTEPRS